MATVTITRCRLQAQLFLDFEGDRIISTSTVHASTSRRRRRDVVYWRRRHRLATALSTFRLVYRGFDGVPYILPKIGQREGRVKIEVEFFNSISVV